MDLLKYLEPMKNLPERFSNLAFWRGVRKLRDEIVNAFEYVDSWGEYVESHLYPQNSVYVLNTRKPTSSVDTDVVELNLDYSIGDTRVFSFKRVGGELPKFPDHVLPFVMVYLPYSYVHASGAGSTAARVVILGEFVFDSEGHVKDIKSVGNTHLTLSDTELANLKNDWTSVVSGAQPRNSTCIIDFWKF